jgi:F-type H+-transporting ATPase subunit gamma
MPSLKSYRVRITSVKSTQKITKAMQMVAASKLRRAQDAAERARPYATRMAAVISNLSQGLKGDSAPRLLAGTGADRVHLIVVATSERGLCGGFNTQIARLARDEVNKLIAAGKTVKIITVGKKGRDQLKRLFAPNLIDHVDTSHVKNVDSSVAHDIGNRIRALFDAGEFDVCTLFYSKFKSAIQQIPTAQQLVPAIAPAGDDVKAPDLKGAIYTYEPNEGVILEALLPKYIDGQIFSALLENAAGFFGAQMGAMDNATRNAGDLIKKLTLQMNRKRQAMITTELTEIIAGAESV